MSDRIGRNGRSAKSASVRALRVVLNRRLDRSGRLSRAMRATVFATAASVAAIGCGLVVAETHRASAEPLASVPAVQTSPRTSSLYPPSTDLSSVIRFAEIGECQFVPDIHQALNRVLFYDDVLWDWRSAPSVTIGALKLEPVRTVFPLESEGHTMRKIQGVLRFPDETTWHGLRLDQMISSIKGYPDIDGFIRWELTFRDSAAAVRKVFAAQGLSIPAGKWHEMKEGCGGDMAIEPRVSGAALTCSWTC